MTCVDQETLFRLLDGYAGWDENSATGLAPLDNVLGLRLEQPLTVSGEELSPFMPPPWIAPGCRPGEWYLISNEKSDLQPPRYSCQSSDECPRLLRRDACTDWRDQLPKLAAGQSLKNPVAVAVSRRRLAVLDHETPKAGGKLFVWSISDGRLAGYAELPRELKPLDAAFSSWCELVVSVTADDS